MNQARHSSGGNVHVRRRAVVIGVLAIAVALAIFAGCGELFGSYVPRTQ